MAYSEVAPSSGIYSTSDSAPTTETLSTGKTTLIDNAYTTIVDSYYWYAYFSYGIDFGSVKAFDRIVCHCYHVSSTDESAWGSIAYQNTFEVYVSSNNLNWTLVGTFAAPTVISHTNSFFAFECVFASTQNARYVKILPSLATGTQIVKFGSPTSYSAKICEIEAFVEAEVDVTALSDMALDIKAFFMGMEDAGLDIAACYQDIKSCPVDIQTLGEESRDNMLDIAVGFLAMIDLPLSVMLSKEINMNVVMDILLSSGIITRNMAMDINVGDGNKRQDLGVDIMAVTARPEFRYVYAMNLSSVIKEIAE